MNQVVDAKSFQIVTTADELARLLAKERVDRAPIEMVSGVLRPKDIDGVWRIAQMHAAAGSIPDSLRYSRGPNEGQPNVAAVAVVLSAGYTVGFNDAQSMAWIMVVNNRASVWGDGALALVYRAKVFESIEEIVEGEGDSRVARCLVKRTGGKVVERSFSWKEAQNAQIIKGVWLKYPRRMLQMRARAFALRDVFPDVLMGLSIAEEQLDVEPDPAAKSAVPSFGAAIDSLTAPKSTDKSTDKPTDRPTDRPKEPAKLPDVTMTEVIRQMEVAEEAIEFNPDEIASLMRDL